MPSGLAQAAWLGGLLFVIGFVAGWVLYRREGALRMVGRWIQWVRNRLLRKRAPRHDLPDLLVRERNEIGDALEDSWWKALLFASGNWLFDYLALLAALAAAGAPPSTHAGPARLLGLDGPGDDPDHARAGSGSWRRG